MTPHESLGQVLRPELIREWIEAGQELEAIFQSLPVWQRKIFEHLMGALDRAHGVNAKSENDAKLLGIVTGQMIAFAKRGLIDEKSLETASPNLQDFLKTLSSEQVELKNGLSEMAQQITSDMQSLDLAEQADFNFGKAKALEKNVEGVDFFRTDATEIYIVLLRLAPIMPQIKSVSHLREILCQIIPENRVGDIKRLERICQRIELSFIPPGRPPETKS